MRLLRCSAVLLAIGAAGCGGASSGTGAPPDACSAARLRLSPGPEISPATGQNPQAIRLTNRGPRCALHGYPLVRFDDTAGRRIPFRIADSGDQMVTAAAPAKVMLPTHGSAWIVVNKYRCDLGDLQPVGVLELRVEGTGRAATLRTGSNGWAYCGSGDPGSIVHTSPFEPTLLAALRSG